MIQSVPSVLQKLHSQTSVNLAGQNVAYDPALLSPLFSSLPQCMSLQDLVNLSGVPGLATAVECLKLTYDRVQNVKVHRQRCTELANRCVALILALREKGSGLEGTQTLETADEIEYTIQRVYDKITEWATLSSLKSFLQQGDIELAIQRLEHDIQTSGMKFNISMQLQLAHRQQESITIHERDNAELRETLQVITRSIGELLAMRSEEAVEEVMQGLQEELHDPSLEAGQEEEFREAMWKIHETTSIMPPLADLTGQITQTSDHPVVLGTNNDVYRGKWLGNEDVALRLPRALGHTPIVHAKFQHEINLWKELKHEHVNPLYGLVYIGDNMFSVSPWMDFGTSISYVKQFPDVDRLQIISGVASGLEYLHLHNIVHGDLRGANILISRDGVPRLSDFGLSKLLEEVGQGMTSSAGNNPRWFAPELLQETALVSTFSDVWSFGMTCLELITGEQPFSNMSRDVTVLLEIVRGKTPDRPLRPAVSNELWSMLQGCWRQRPEARASMSANIRTIAQLRLPSSSSSVVVPASPSPRQPKSRFSIPRFRSSSSSGSSVYTTDSTTTGTSPGRLRTLFTRSPSQKASSLKSSSETDARNNKSTVPGGKISPICLDISTGGGLRTFSSDGDSVQSPTNGVLLSPIVISQSVPKNFGIHMRQESSPSPSISDAASFVSSAPTSSAPDCVSVSDVSSSDIRVNKSGIVIAGTLDGLVAHLVAHSNLSTNTEFRDIFLMTYTGFTSHGDILTVLFQKFHEQNDNPQSRAEVRVNVMAIIRHWVSASHVRIDVAVLSRIDELCLSVLSDSMTSSIVKKKAKEVISALRSRDLDDTFFESTMVLSPGRRLKPSEILPRDLAIALTLLEGRMFGRILPADYIAHLQPPDHSSGPSLLNMASELNNRIGAWVKKSVLHSDTVERRGDALKFFVNTAQECRNLRNFSSLAAVVTALTSAPIQRLVLTRRQLSPQATQMLERLNDILDVSRSHEAYKSALNELSGSEPGVPWIAIHLVDMSSVLQRFPATVLSADDGRELINFTRYMKLGLRLKYVMQFEPPDLEQYRTQGQLAYLENQLRNVRDDAMSDDQLSARSFKLATDEKKQHDNRETELRSVGFRV